jgi:hypothetical protein
MTEIANRSLQRKFSAMVIGTSGRQMIQKVSDTIWELPTTFKESMQVPARIYATAKLVHEAMPANIEIPPDLPESGDEAADCRVNKLAYTLTACCLM